MIYRYNITLEHHFKNAWGILIFLAGYSLLPYYLVYRFGSEDIIVYYIGCFVLFLLFFIPQLVVHLRYYWLDRGRIFYYIPDNQRFSLCLRDGREFKFSFDDIEQLERNKSYPLAENRMLWFPWDSYNYSVIRLKNGQQFIVTSLLVLNMDLPLEDSKIKLRKRFYSYPFGAKEIIEVKDNLIVENNEHEPL